MINKNFTPAQKIAKETTISFVGMGYGQFVRYLFTALLARLVGIEYLGIYSLGHSVTNLARVISKAGTDVGLMRYISRQDSVKDRELIKHDIRSTLKMVLVFSIIIMLVQIILSKWLVINLFHGSSLLRIVLIVYAISIPFTAIMTVATFATQGFQLLKYKIFVEYILNPTVILISMLFVYFTFSNELTIVLPTLLTGISGFIVSNYFLKKITNVNILDIGNISFNKKIFTYSLPIMFTAILGSLLHWMDIMMLGYFTNVETVGLYHPAVRTASIQQAVLIAFSGIFAPMFSRYYAQNYIIGFRNIYKLVTRWILTLVIPVFILIMLFSTKIMLLFGTDFLQASRSLIILTVGTSIFTIFGIGGTALAVSGYQKINLINVFVALILNLALNIILIPKYGIDGAAWATLSSMLLIALARLAETWIFLKINPFSSKVIKPITAGFITCGILLFIKPYIMMYHTVITLVISSMIIFVVYGFILLIFKFDEDDKDFLRSLNFLKNEVIKPSDNN
ncbi:MAG: flippase [Candidatus Neomarinimicrobiota bacterium]